MEALQVMLFALRYRLDEAIHKAFPYDKSLHLIGGLITFSISYGNGFTLLAALLWTLLVGVIVEIAQKVFKIGVASIMDVIYWQLGASIPTIAIIGASNA